MVGWNRDVGQSSSHGPRRTWARASDGPSVEILRTKFSKVGGLCSPQLNLTSNTYYDEISFISGNRV